MQKYTGIFILILSVNVFAQFPPPQNFNYQLNYIEMDKWGECDGQFMAGPAFCSRYQWSFPDTALTASVLASFEIYNVFQNDTLFIHALSDTIYENTIPYEGDLFVVAVYSIPEGKSGPSNIVNNPGIPIPVNEPNFKSDIRIRQFSENNWLEIVSNTKIICLKITDITGHQVCNEKNLTLPIYIGHLKPGIYIIEVSAGLNQSVKKKFIKL